MQRISRLKRSQLVRFAWLPLCLLLAACQGQAPTPENKPKPTVTLIEPTLPPAPPKPVKPELPPLFGDIERRTFQFFWDTTNEVNGLTPERFPSRPFASIASVGSGPMNAGIRLCVGTFQTPAALVSFTNAGMRDSSR